jgi:lipopolysaccharide export system permease protein
MTRIDRYLLFLYLRALTICFLSVCGLVIVIHIFSNLDEFLQYSREKSKSLPVVLIGYYGPFALTIFEKLSGMLALLALLFTIAWLEKTRELTALLAAGIPKRRIIRPLLVASLGIILAAVAVREFAIPQYQDQLNQNPQDLAGSPNRNVLSTFDYRAMVLIMGKSLMPREARILEPELQAQGGPILEACGGVISASTARFDSGTAGRPVGYMLERVKQPLAIDTIPSIRLADGEPLILTALDTDWVPAGNCFFVSEVPYRILRGDQGWKQFASTVELIAHLRDKATAGGDDLRIAIHNRFVRGAVDWTVLLLGLPVLLTRPERNMFWTAGTCVMIVALFTGVVMAFGALASSAQFLSPLIAVWGPLLLFLPWGWAQTQSAMQT